MTDRIAEILDALNDKNVTEELYREAIAYMYTADKQLLRIQPRIEYCNSCVHALLQILSRNAPVADDPRKYCLEMLQLQSQLHSVLYPQFVSLPFANLCAELAEVYATWAKAFAQPLLEMSKYATISLEMTGDSRRQFSDLSESERDACEFLYALISVYHSMVITTDDSKHRRTLAQRAIALALPFSEFPAPASTDLQILDLLHIAPVPPTEFKSVYKSNFFRANTVCSSIALSSTVAELLRFTMNHFPPKK